MEEGKLEERVKALDREISALKAQIKIGQGQQGASSIERVARVLITNWVLISFIAALGTAVYVKFRFGIDYLESYRNLSTTKTLSEFHRRMGDRLMVSAEWEAAEQSYQSALQINPNNIKATYGLIKAHVFHPLPGKKYYTPEVVDARLQYLSSEFPDDDDIYYLKATRYFDQQDNGKAKKLLHHCIDKNPKAVACYLLLGYISQGEQDLHEAEANFSKVIELDPSVATARNNLGFCHLLGLKVGEAIDQLEKAYAISPIMVTGINLGDAYRYSGKLDQAREWHEFVLSTVNNQEMDRDRYILGEWTYNFMPVYRGDVESIRSLIRVYTLEQKQAIAHFALSLDFALIGELGKATEEFDRSLKLEGGSMYKRFFANKMLSTENIISPRDQVIRRWLASHRSSLE